MKNIYGLDICQAENKIIFDELKKYEKKTSNLIEIFQKNSILKTERVIFF